MSAQTTSNKATLRRFCDATNSGDAKLIAETIDELVDPDALIRTPLPIQATGAQALKEVFARLHRAYPDLHSTVEDVIEEGDKVVARNTVTGTHQGEYMGLQPTGKSVTYNEIFIFRFAGGRSAETWGVVDVFSQLKQLGVTSAANLARPVRSAAADVNSESNTPASSQHRPPGSSILERWPKASESWIASGGI